MSDVVLALKNKSRDNARTPMQWTDEEHGGHKGKPWMRMHESVIFSLIRRDCARLISFRPRSSP